jgi:RimJ/RimL family protein N-acetyltransferase
LVKRQGGGPMELEIECDPRNTGSWKLAERLGFEEHSLTKNVQEIKGEWVDSLVYRKTVGI